MPRGMQPVQRRPLTQPSRIANSLIANGPLNLTHA